MHKTLRIHVRLISIPNLFAIGACSNKNLANFFVILPILKNRTAENEWWKSNQVFPFWLKSDKQCGPFM